MSNGEFEIVIGDSLIKTCWNSCGTIGIIQKPNDTSNLGNYVSLKLDEIDTVLKNGSYLFEGERPAKFPNKKKITVITKEDSSIEIKSESPWENDTVTISKETLQKIYDIYKDNAKTA